MKSRVVSSMLAVIGTVALFAAVAHAGGAAGAASFSTFFACESINGASPGQVVGTQDFDGVVLDANVQVGKAVLKCRQVNVTDSAGAFVNPDPSTDLKCYSVNVKGPQAGPEELTLVDAFFPSGDPVRVFQPLRYLCGPTIPVAVP